MMMSQFIYMTSVERLLLYYSFIFLSIVYTRSMKLIIGLGNPEDKYTNTRHNIGFFVLDQFANENGVKWQLKERFKAYVAELPDKSALLIKPTTYYNLVGESVRALADFYKITPENILVIHDELALPFGTIRTREQGSDAGNNGIKSLNIHLGHATKRLRVGIHNELAVQMNAADFVLAKFTSDEKLKLPDIIKNTHQMIDGFLSDSFEPTTL